MMEVKTDSGEKREVHCKPPTGVWKLLRELNFEGVPRPAEENQYLWLLLKAVYGLNDAPRLWSQGLCEYLKANGWTVSYMDRSIFYYRQGGKRRGKLLGMVSVHVDDLAIIGEEDIIKWFRQVLESRYGEVKYQRDDFKHVGHHYVQQ